MSERSHSSTIPVQNVNIVCEFRKKKLLIYNALIWKVLANNIELIMVFLLDRGMYSVFKFKSMYVRLM